MAKEVDTTLPFIAIRKDVEGDYFDRTMGEYLCNPFSEDLLDVEVSTGGWYSDPDLGIIESTAKSPKPTLVVPAGQAVRFTLSTEDEYDEMACHWSLRYRTESNGVVSVSFSTFKRLEDTQSFTDVPIMGGPGQVVPRC